MSFEQNASIEITRPSKNITCILAPNPSPMTFKGTNTYIVGDAELAIIDPGPISDVHFANIIKVIANRPVKFIFLTHSHICLLYTSPSPRDAHESRMPSSA